MSAKLAVLVTGVTGKQGGAVARQLVQEGHRARGLTRDAGSPGAKALAAAGIELVQGDLEDRASVDRALGGMDAMFLVCTPYGSSGDAETRQGKGAADAAHAAGVFLVYSSVANADRRTGVPHFDSKLAVEEHIRSRGIEAAILAPAFFMENVMFSLPQLRQGAYASPVAPTRRIVQVAVSDIGAAAVAALTQRARFAGKRYDLGSDELSGEELVAALSKVAGRSITYSKLPMEVIRAARGEDAVKMYEWFERTGYSVDRAALRRDFPSVPWRSFETWARAQDWNALLAPGAR